jgi:hypothetical protein
LFLGNDFPIPERFVGNAVGTSGLSLSKTAHNSNYWCRSVVWTTDTGHRSVRRQQALPRGLVVSNADEELKRDLECLRLASDFIQLSRDTLDPDLQAHCVRMANYWSDRADRDADEPDNPG